MIHNLYKYYRENYDGIKYNGTRALIVQTHIQLNATIFFEFFENCVLLKKVPWSLLNLMAHYIYIIYINAFFTYHLLDKHNNAKQGHISD